jgi:putative multicomponent Na+:H+ antiporter subunit B
MIDSYVYAIVALLPLSALMVVIQANPYQALVTRGILGAMAALVYAVLGGADVALTEALVGTMLAITLYAVAVRSSLVMRLGVVESLLARPETPLQNLLDPLRRVIKAHHLRLEMVPYPDGDSLAQALKDKAVHGIYQIPAGAEGDSLETLPNPAFPQVTLRVPRLYDILTAELPPNLVQLQLMPVVDPPQASPSLITLTEKPQA